ncbi:hemolysin family protein [Luteimicrobium subarcticum]|uniref:CBS domain containing-hemolysin-like protein n=1 Tax=Luteimicrobium subarcticum TaxID=620910 RepID=A0A2M8WWD2_9MICO|nr:hemolysin family protein [Luteimicrobium subarcticum]PJI95234.1 CBS domain containing-hemolysin-like protein [Luteimicrobium subarcticum]
MSPGVGILFGLVLLLGNAFFVGAEFSVLSARRSAIEPLADAGNARARTVIYAMEHVSLMLACAQLGVTVCSTGLGVVAEPALAHLIEVPVHALGASEALVHPIALVIALAIVVYLHVVLGEMVPKNLAVSGPDRAVMLFGPPLVWMARAVRPVIHALNWLANHAVRLGGVEPRDEVASTFTVEEVQSIVEHSAAEGALSDEQGLLAGALEFSEKSARDVMVPLGDLVTVDAGCTPHDVEQLVTRTGFSRFPVVRGADVVGYLHLKDVLYASDDDRDQPVPDLSVRPLAPAAPDDEVEDVLRAMQLSGAHLAIVDGGPGEPALGVVFLEDILEELVGEVRDAMQRGTGVRVARRAARPARP